MKIFETVTDYREWRKSIGSQKTIGFVPTMGALHAGHASLLKKAREENDFTVLSIFVNPTQFNQKEDFDKYPKTEESDLALAKLHGVDAVFYPTDPKELYPHGYHYQVIENEFSKTLCGEFRPGHFEGVLTVVLKLFQIIMPTHAYFGEKDHQQLKLIEGMVSEFFLPVRIVPCATVREKDGLAMSSRNARLNREEKALASFLYEAMSKVDDLKAAKDKIEDKGFKVEYLNDVPEGSGSRRYIAAWLGKVRLIDNVKR